MAAQLARTIVRQHYQDYMSIADNHPQVKPPRLHQSRHIWLWYLNQDKARITASERLSILFNLRELYEFNRSGFDLTEYLQLTEICQYLCDWQLLAEAASNGLALQPENLQLKCQLLTACWHIGDYQAAVTLATRYVLNDPGHSLLYHYYQQIFLWKDFVERRLSFAPALLRAERLYLQLFGHQHAEDFFWQYADSQIAELCCLPVFHSLAEWHQWLSIELADNNRTTYAIMHPQWGLIGVVCLIRYEELGIFYYWLGKDFQGYGFGPEAIDLLLTQTIQRGLLSMCFAKVYDSNLASIKGLRKAGFDLLPFSAQSPHGDELFFYRGPSLQLEFLQSELIRLLDFMNSSIELNKL